jgi:hypothetical protein
VQRIRPGELVLERAEGPALRLKVDSTTPVMRAGQPGALADLEPGARVRVRYHLEADQPIADRIDHAAGAATRQGRRSSR